jgi:hypothetical protein
MTPRSNFFWRSLAHALAHVWHPRMLLLILVPFVVCALVAGAAGFLGWEAAVAAVRDTLDGWELLHTAADWLQWAGLPGAKSFIAPLVVITLAVPVTVVLALLVTALIAMPAAVSFVTQRRFAALARKGRAAWLTSATASLGWTFIALVLLLLSVPLWFIPPLFFVLPPLIWGWLTYKVMSVDALAAHASADERNQLIRNHRAALLAIGIVTGLIGAVPSLLWVSSAMTIVLFPLISVLSLALYAAGFVFTALWFAHYCLAALEDLRGQQQALEAIA